MNLNSLLNIIGLGIILYFFLVSAGYLIIFLISFIAIVRYHLRARFATPNEILKARITPPISILSPAYNEAKSIIPSVDSLLKLQYGEFEVIVINDGSRDETLSVLKEHFDLKKTKRVYHQVLKTEEVYGIYRSLKDKKLIVIDKKNGGKADALNAGINVSTYPLFCSTDADSLLERTSMIRVVYPFMEAYTTVMAVGGIVRAANGCRFRHGELVEAGLSSKWIVNFQVVEYFRAFLSGRMGWSLLNSLLVISGAFSIFKKDPVVKAGGYKRDTVGEDMELVVRLHRWLRTNKIPYQILFIPDPVCWTEVPETWKFLSRQRNRWQRGLAESLYSHIRMLLNPFYGVVGLFAMPYFLFVECLSPAVELSGYVIMTFAIVYGAISWKAYFVFIFLAVFLGVLLSLLALLIEEAALHRYSRIRDLLKLCLASVLENFGYRQILSFIRMKALFDFARKRKVWGHMERVGLGVFLFLLTAFLPGPVYSGGAQAILKARESKAQGEFKEALTHYMRAIESMPDEAELLKEAAQVAGWTGEYDTALDWYKIVLERNPKDLDAELGRAFVLSWKKEYSMAVAIFKKIVNVSPTYLDAWVGLARTESWRGNFEASEKAYLEALRQNANYPDALQGLMDLYRWHGKNKKGIGIAKRILQPAPEDLAALISIGIFYRDSGQSNLAMKAFQKALKIDPERPDIHAELGQLYARALELDNAVTELQKAVALNQNNIDAYVTLGRVYSYKRKIGDSVSIYEKALSKDPNNLDALNGLARTYGYGHFWKKSEATFQKVIEIDPLNQEAHEGLRRLGRFMAPAFFLRHFFTTVRDKEPPESVGTVHLLQGEFNYPLDPDKSVDFRIEFGDQIQKDKQTEETDFHVRQVSPGLGTHWAFPLGFSFIGRANLTIFQDRGENDYNIGKQTYGSGFGVAHWEYGPNTVSLTVSKENFLSIWPDGNFNVSNIVNLSAIEDIDITDRLSLLYEIGYNRYSGDRESRPEQTGRLRYRIPLGGILLMEYRFRYLDHPDERNHKIFLSYKGQIPGFRYRLEYSPDHDSLSDKIGHGLKFFLSFTVTPEISLDTEAEYSYNSEGFSGRVFHTFCSLRTRF